MTFTKDTTTTAFSSLNSKDNNNNTKNVKQQCSPSSLTPKYSGCKGFSPRFDAHSPLLSFAPLSPPLNPNARSFVPGNSPSLRTAQDHLCRAVEIDQLPMLDDTTATVGVETSPEDVAAMQSLRKAAAQPIRYSIKQLMAMKPLNPKAAEFTPLWLQGVHTQHDFVCLLQAKEQQQGVATTAAAAATTGAGALPAAHQHQHQHQHAQEQSNRKKHLYAKSPRSPRSEGTSPFFAQKAA